MSCICNSICRDLAMLNPYLLLDIDQSIVSVTGYHPNRAPTQEKSKLRNLKPTYVGFTCVAVISNHLLNLKI